MSRQVAAQAVVAASQSGRRADQVAAMLFPEFSRTQLTTWIREGRLTVDGASVAPKRRLAGGETMLLRATLADASAWHSPQDVGFSVVFEDDHLLVIDKPAGLVVHPGAGNPDRTLVNGLLAWRPGLAALPRAGLIHRLDKDTSGLMIVAASSEALRALTAALAARDIHRRYVAVVEGVLTGGRDIDAPIGRDPGNRLRQRVLAGGRPALTHIRMLERFRVHALVQADLSTGRTHQIRVHMSSIGHPLVGDRRYGARGRLPPTPTPALVDTVRGFRRQALHAQQLALSHPITDAALAFASELPADLEDLLAALREDQHRFRAEAGHA